MEKQANLTWPSVFDGPRGPVARAWEVQAFPTLILIDQSGVVRLRHEGAPAEGTLERKIEALLREGIKDRAGS